jgi:predicted RNA-binding Zn-ribbon protein involved in translation (DUF1610 family)
VKAISGKPKKCKHCKTLFVPARNFQTWCSPDCAVEIAKAAQAKKQAQEAVKERAEHAKRKEATKTKGQHTKEAQIAFNAFIRERDKDLPCVSCGRHHQGQYHAGHYRTTAAAPELRFEPLNVWKQCAPCNNHKSGNLIEYRIELVRRIGADRVEWLEGTHEPKRYTIEDLKAIKAEYRAKLRELQK